MLLPCITSEIAQAILDYRQAKEDKHIDSLEEFLAIPQVNALSSATKEVLGDRVIVNGEDDIDYFTNRGIKIIVSHNIREHRRKESTAKIIYKQEDLFSILSFISEEHGLLCLLNPEERSSFNQRFLSSPREVPYEGLFWPIHSWNEVFSQVKGNQITVTLRGPQDYSFTLNIPARELTGYDNWLIGYYLSHYILNRATLIPHETIEINAPEAVFNITRDILSSEQFRPFNLNLVYALNHTPMQALPKAAKIILSEEKDHLSLTVIASDGSVIPTTNNASSLVIDMSLNAKRNNLKEPHGMSARYLTQEATINMAKEALMGKLRLDEVEDSFIKAVKSAEKAGPATIEEITEKFWLSTAKFYNHFRMNVIMLPESTCLTLDSATRLAIARAITQRLTQEFTKFSILYSELFASSDKPATLQILSLIRIPSRSR